MTKPLSYLVAKKDSLNDHFMPLYYIGKNRGKT